MVAEPTTAAVAAFMPVVTELVARFAPGELSPASIAPDAELVRDLAFDSVRLVELLLTVDEQLGVALPIEMILAGEALSVYSVAAHVARARPGGAA